MSVRARACVLVVDDELPQLDMLARWLAFSGYVPITARCGDEALALAEERRIDVIVTDLRMPGFDGVRLLQELRSLRPHVPAIVLSGQGTARDVLEHIRRGEVFGFLQKPLPDLRALTLAIEGALASVPRAPGTSVPDPVADGRP